jgi:1-phosphatidylinositol-3-phosphate 5-kinase
MFRYQYILPKFPCTTRDDEPCDPVQKIQSQDLAVGNSLHYENLIINPSILVPPGPAVQEEEKDASLTRTNFEDDEDDVGGVVGTTCKDESTSPSPTSTSNSISDVKRHFKLLVRRFLKDEGNPLVLTEGDSWLDVVANISWEAAELIKPEPSEGKEMDPWSYIKVKCVASGTPTERYCHFFSFSIILF